MLLWFATFLCSFLPGWIAHARTIHVVCECVKKYLHISTYTRAFQKRCCLCPLSFGLFHSCQLQLHGCPRTPKPTPHQKWAAESPWHQTSKTQKGCPQKRTTNSKAVTLDPALFCSSTTLKSESSEWKHLSVADWRSNKSLCQSSFCWSSDGRILQTLHNTELF